MDSKAEDYLQKQKYPLRNLCIKLREIILNNFPTIKETVMTEGFWYEGKFYLTIFKDHVNLGVGISGLNQDEIKHFEGKGKTLRHLKFFSLKDIHEEELLQLMQLVYSKCKCTEKINWKS
jgi:hypothetical protein